MKKEKENFDQINDVQDAIVKRKKTRKWTRIVGALSAAVVFCTTYALVLPAITMTEDTIPDGISYSSAESVSDTAGYAEDTPDAAPDDWGADTADYEGEDTPDAAPDEEDTPDASPSDVFGEDDDDGSVPLAPWEDTPDAAPEDEDAAGGSSSALKGSSDILNDFTTRAVVRDSKDKILLDTDVSAEATLELTRSYALTLTFEETGDHQLAYGEDGTLAYYLPACFAAQPTAEPVDIFYAADEDDAEPVVIGSYEINAYGMITVRFENCTREGEPIEKNYIDFYRDTNIELAITVTAAGDIGPFSAKLGEELAADITLIEKQVPLLVKLLPGLFGTGVTAEDLTTITADNGTITAYLTYTEDAAIPEDAILTVNDLTNDLDYAAACEQAAGEIAGGAALQGLVNLTLTDAAGNEVIPQADVTVTLQFTGIEAAEGTSYAPVVFTEDGAVAEIVGVSSADNEEDAAAAEAAADSRNPIAALLGLFAPKADAVEAAILYDATVTDDADGVTFSYTTGDLNANVGVISYGELVLMADYEIAVGDTKTATDLGLPNKNYTYAWPSDWTPVGVNTNNGTLSVTGNSPTQSVTVYYQYRNGNGYGPGNNTQNGSFTVAVYKAVSLNIAADSAGGTVNGQSTVSVSAKSFYTSNGKDRVSVTLPGSGDIGKNIAATDFNTINITAPSNRHKLTGWKYAYWGRTYTINVGETSVTTTLDIPNNEIITLTPVWENNTAASVIFDAGLYAGQPYKGIKIGTTISPSAQRCSAAINIADDGTCTIKLPTFDQNAIEPNDDGVRYAATSVQTGNTVWITQTTSGYQWTLAGWYNITTGDYYAPGREITIDPAVNNVFYADWMAADYNTGDDRSHLYTFKDKNGNTVNTNQLNDSDYGEYVHNYVFDYSELYNAPYCTPSGGSATATENWSDKQTGLVFDDGTGYGSKLYLPSSRCGENTYIGSKKPYAGILGGVGSSVLNTATGQVSGTKWCASVNELFTPNSEAVGVHYLGEGSGLLYYNTTDGSYEYDSSKHIAAYNQADQSFSVYTDNTRTDKFLPFNERTHDGSTGNGTNLAFGLRTEIDFYLPSATGTGNNKLNGNDIVYEFAGDDDVWVFIDDMLVLDIGGIHGATAAKLNLNTGAYSVTNGGSTIYSSGTVSVSAGEHKLTMLYMERGGSLSNCRIKFNLVPRSAFETPVASTISAEKVWSGDGLSAHNPIKLALFSVENGVVSDTFIPGTERYLNADNSWFYTWEGLDPDVKYTVREIETIPDYAVSYTSKYSQSHDYWCIYSPGANAEKGIKSFAQLVAEGKVIHGSQVVIADPTYTGDSTRDGSVRALTMNADGTLGQKTLTLQNGVLLTADVTADMKWTIEKSDLSGSWNGTWYIGMNGQYLAIGEAGLNLTDKGSASTFEYSEAEGWRLNANGYHIASRSSGFFAEGNTSTGDTGNEAYLYGLQDVSSTVYSFTVTNTYQPTMSIRKVNAMNPGEGLVGAVFTLQRPHLNAMTIAINEATGEMGTIFVEEPGFVDYYTTAGEWVRAASTTPVSDTGTITVDGKTYTVWLTTVSGGYISVKTVQDTLTTTAEDGTVTRGTPYTLTEIKAPDGFGRLYEPISFTVSNGKIEQVSIGTHDTAYTMEGNALMLVVEDPTYYALPQSGGPGTAAYTLGGMAMLCLGGAYVFLKRRGA